MLTALAIGACTSVPVACLCTACLFLKRRHGDTETRRHGDTKTRGHEDRRPQAGARPAPPDGPGWLGRRARHCVEHTEPAEPGGRRFVLNTEAAEIAENVGLNSVYSVFSV